MKIEWPVIPVALLYGVLSGFTTFLFGTLAVLCYLAFKEWPLFMSCVTFGTVGPAIIWYFVLVKEYRGDYGQTPTSD